MGSGRNLPGPWSEGISHCHLPVDRLAIVEVFGIEGDASGFERSATIKPVINIVAVLRGDFDSRFVQFDGDEERTLQRFHDLGRPPIGRSSAEYCGDRAQQKRAMAQSSWARITRMRTLEFPAEMSASTGEAWFFAASIDRPR